MPRHQEPLPPALIGRLRDAIDRLLRGGVSEWLTRAEVYSRLATECGLAARARAGQRGPRLFDKEALRLMHEKGLVPAETRAPQKRIAGKNEAVFERLNWAAARPAGLRALLLGS